MQISNISTYRQFEKLLRNQAQRLNLQEHILQKFVFQSIVAMVLEQRARAMNFDIQIIGGIGLQIRLGPQHRATLDFDFAVSQFPESFSEFLAPVISSDHQPFAIRFAELSSRKTSGSSVTLFECLAKLSWRDDPKVRSSAKLEFTQHVLPQAERLYPQLTDFQSPHFEFSRLPVIDVRYQVAHKIHALTQPNLLAKSLRLDDLFDLVVLLNSYDMQNLLVVIQEVFQERNTHELVPVTPLDSWEAEWTRLVVANSNYEFVPQDLHSAIAFVNSYLVF